MAVGDPVNVNMSGVTYYQPAATVVIMHFKTYSSLVATYYGFTDGTLITQNHHTAGDYDGVGLGAKFPITNTNYYYNNNTGSWSGFAGIQIQ